MNMNFNTYITGYLGNLFLFYITKRVMTLFLIGEEY